MLIDCPPGMTPLTMNALVAASRVLVPTQLDFLSVAGLAVLMETVEEVREYDNPQLRYLGIVGTQVDERTRHAREIRAQLEQLFGANAGGVLCRTTIRHSTRVRDAHAAGLAVGQFDPAHPVSDDYRALADELAVRARLELATGGRPMSAAKRADAGAAVGGLFDRPSATGGLAGAARSTETPRRGPVPDGRLGPASSRNGVNAPVAGESRVRLGVELSERDTRFCARCRGRPGRAGGARPDREVVGR